MYYSWTVQYKVDEATILVVAFKAWHCAMFVYNALEMLGAHFAI